MSKTAIFWEWFKEYNTILLNLNNISEERKETLLDEVLEHLHHYCDQLYFEIGSGPEKEQELIITADGNHQYFKNVEELIDSAPVIENWNFTAFLQPRELDYTSNFEDVELKPLEIWFLPLDSKSKPKSIGLRICLSNYELVRESKWLKAAVYKIMDTVLGEKTFALDIDHIEINSLPEKPEDHGMMELRELSAFIKWKKEKLSSV
jgi:hypothetical protein